MTLFEELKAIAPLIILGFGAMALLIVDVVVPSGVRKGSGQIRGYIAIVTMLAALMMQFSLMSGMPQSATLSATLFHGTLYYDPISAFFTFFIILGSLMAALVGHGTTELEGTQAHAEFYALYLMSALGAIIFASAAELVTLFLGLEIMSMALYCLCGSCIHGPEKAVQRSAESALKYFLLGSFSSAFMLYGIALVYGLTGSMEIATLANFSPNESQSTIYAVALGFMLVGIVFKLGAVPFHFWAPDVYQGAPTQITAFMACVIKASAVAVAMRILWVGFSSQVVIWSGVVWTVALLTMIVGNVVALTQRSIKRMLAYSSIAHAGYMLMALLAPGDNFGGGPALLFYLVSYTAMTLGSFGVVLLITAPYADKSQPDDLSRFNGLGNRRPVMAALLSLFMLSLAGIPPGMAGLLGKFYLFSAAIKANYVGLAIVGVLMSAVSCYYYLRVIVVMYFLDPEEEQIGEERKIPISICLGGALALCAVAVIFVGLFPSILYDGVNTVASSILAPTTSTQTALLQ